MNDLWKPLFGSFRFFECWNCCWCVCVWIASDRWKGIEMILTLFLVDWDLQCHWLPPLVRIEQLPFPSYGWCFFRQKMAGSPIELSPRGSSFKASEDVPNDTPLTHIGTIHIHSRLTASCVQIRELRRCKGTQNQDDFLMFSGPPKCHSYFVISFWGLVFQQEWQQAYWQTWFRHFNLCWCRERSISSWHFAIGCAWAIAVMVLFHSVPGQCRTTNNMSRTNSVSLRYCI